MHCCPVLAAATTSTDTDSPTTATVPTEPPLVAEADITHLLSQFTTVFREGLPPGLPPDRGIGHTILLEPGHNPPFRRNKRVSPAELAVCKEYIHDLLAKGLITPSTSPYGAAVMFVAKKNGGFRVCCDWRMLNKITVKNRYPLPRIDETLDALAGSSIFSSLDLCSGYFQIRISEEDAHKTAFTTPLGHFEFKVLGQGLANSPATFQSVMNRLFSKQIGRCVVVYLDDIMVYSKNPAEHLQHLTEVLTILQQETLYADINKCKINKPEVEFLGHIVGRHGLKVNPKKIEVVQTWPQPTDATQIRQFLGLTNYFRKFIQGYSSLTSPLHTLTHKNTPFAWTDQHTTIFNQLKEALVSAPVLKLPDFSLPFQIVSDASLLGTGAVLMQEEHVIAYSSKKFGPAEKNYTTGEQELLGVHNALTEWRCYVEGNECTLITDHNPLVYLSTQPNLSRRQARWMEFINRFHYNWQYRPGRFNVADPVSRNPNLQCIQLCAITRAQSQHSFLSRIIAAYAKDPHFSNTLNTAKYTKHNQLWLFNDKGTSRTVVPDYSNLRQDIITEMHAPMYQGHVGIDRTMHNIHQLFYWPRIRADVETHIHACHQCQVNKAPSQCPGGTLKPIAIPTAPWECFTTDLITCLPPTPSNNTAIIVFVCKLTKLVHFVATRDDINAEQFAELYIQHVWKHHGLSAKIISDRDSKFTSHFTSEVCRLLGTKQALSTSFHPQSDGQTENMNRTLSDMLRHYIGPYRTDWDKYLPLCEFAVNNSFNSTIQTTPFLLTYGQSPLTPVSLQLQSKTPAALRFVQNYSERLKLARTAIAAAQDRQKAYADKHRRSVHFEVGQLVVLHTKNLKFKCAATFTSHKLLPRYVGPFPITRLVPHNRAEPAIGDNISAAELKLPQSMTIHNVFHTSMIKPYTTTSGSIGNTPLAPVYFETDGSPIFEVEALLQKRERTRSGRLTDEYLVRWKGYSPSDDTWEPAANILNQSLLHQFNDRPQHTTTEPTTRPKRRATAA